MRALAAVLLLAVMTGLAGCASAIDQIPTWAGGEPTGAPARPETSGVYPAVHDMPPPRDDVVLTDEERKRLKDELVTIRQRTESNNPTGSVSAPAGTSPKP